MNKTIIKDYFDISLIDKINQYETKLNNNNININNIIKNNKELYNLIETIQLDNNKNKKEMCNLIETIQINNNKNNNIIYETNMNIINKINNFELMIMEKLNIMEKFLNNMDNKLNNVIKTTENLEVKIENIKTSIREIPNNENLEYQRLMNNAIRRHLPINFCTTKTINDLYKLNLHKK